MVFLCIRYETVVSGADVIVSFFIERWESERRSKKTHAENIQSKHGKVHYSFDPLTTNFLARLRTQAAHTHCLSISKSGPWHCGCRLNYARFIRSWSCSHPVKRFNTRTKVCPLRDSVQFDENVHAHTGFFPSETLEPTHEMLRNVINKMNEQKSKSFFVLCDRVVPCVGICEMWQMNYCWRTSVAVYVDRNRFLTICKKLATNDSFIFHYFAQNERYVCGANSKHPNPHISQTISKTMKRFH